MPSLSRLAHPALLGALVLIAALGGSTTAARAGAVATRCGPMRCEVIRCDDRGNRCHLSVRVFDPRRDSLCGRPPAVRGCNRVCDPDGDRCYRSPARSGSYRDYYRRLGYRWQAAGRGWDWQHRPPAPPAAAPAPPAAGPVPAPATEPAPAATAPPRPVHPAKSAGGRARVWHWRAHAESGRSRAAGRDPGGTD